MREIYVLENEAGQRLDKLLHKYLDLAPKSFIYKMLRKKNIVLNGKKAVGNEKLEQGDLIKLFLANQTIDQFTKEKTEYASTALDIIYEDEQVLLINKPIGMLSQKAKPSDTSLAEYVIGYLLESGQITEEQLKSFRPSICNRLDRNTSGLVVVGKSLYALQYFGEMFRERKIGKYYRCIVEGQIIKGQRIQGYLNKNRSTNKVYISEQLKEGSSYIETEYTPLLWGEDSTLLEVHLITGRPHQIRAHLASIGHGIIGDYKYGNAVFNAHYRQKYGIDSQLLHAYRLQIEAWEGRMSGVARREFIAPLPKAWDKVLEEMEEQEGR